jgi:hypothetical protein
VGLLKEELVSRIMAVGSRLYPDTAAVHGLFLLTGQTHFDPMVRRKAFKILAMLLPDLP